MLNSAVWEHAVCASIFLCFMSTTCLADVTIDEIKAMSLAEVMDLSIETSSKKTKKQFNESASTYIITQEDIRRSGVTSLPEALRLAPGVFVARINVNQWAISIHGFNERFSNKLLVLIDGRSVYSPLFSGVYWDAQDILLENVKRIEVIRGSGTALWGSNAVNGVINVISYSAKDTQGIQATAGYGTAEQGFSSLRYGGALGESTHYRIHAKEYNREKGGTINQQAAHDQASMGSGGIHVDSRINENHSLMVTGNAYDGKEGQAGDIPDLTSPTLKKYINNNVNLNGENILARWTHHEGDRKKWAFQAYFDHTNRSDTVLGYQDVSVADFDFQHHLAPIFKQALSWGLQYRTIDNKLTPGTLVSLNPSARTTRLYSGFLSNESSLFNDKVKFNLAARFEHNDFTGFEIQPTARMTWLMNENNTFWGAISRSVKVPSISDQNMSIVPALLRVPLLPFPIAVNMIGNPALNTEKLISYELGYRTRFTHDLQLDVSTFYNDYNQLRTFEDTTEHVVPNPLHLVIQYDEGNKMAGHTYGLDLSTKWAINSWWNMNASYNYVKTALHLTQGSTDYTSLALPVFANAPEHMASLRSAWDMNKDWKLDLTSRYVDRLKSTPINAYINLDARLAWKATRHVELSVVGQNLLSPQQLQFFRDPSTQLYNSAVARSVYFKIRLDF